MRNGFQGEVGDALRGLANQGLAIFLPIISSAGRLILKNEAMGSGGAFAPVIPGQV
jgi:hypothetical protein